ncbi:MAG: hypothetical protein M0Z65_09880 [Firmicutes bacterium]|nr:hypothetical protein [Bacillota bacterium]
MSVLIPILIIGLFTYLLWEIREQQKQTVKRLESIEALLKDGLKEGSLGSRTMVDLSGFPGEGGGSDQRVDPRY